MNDPAAPLAGQTALVTGATNGIGRELAGLLATRGARVYTGCRSRGRFEQTRAALATARGPEVAARLAAAAADLARMAEVEALAARLAREAPPVDLLFLNAGIHDVPHALTSEGHERTYATNYLGHFLLLRRLAETGRLAPRGRVVVTQSEAVHANPFARADLAALERPGATPLRRLAWRATASPNTKMLLALMAVEWRRRMAGGALAEVACLAGSPGPLRTGNVDQPGLAMALLRLAAPLLLRPAVVGAELLLWVATAPELAGRSAEVYGRDRRPVRLREGAQDPELARRAWEVTERVLGVGAHPHG